MAGKNIYSAHACIDFKPYDWNTKIIVERTCGVDAALSKQQWWGVDVAQLTHGDYT